MAARFVNIDYDTPLILPPNLRDWVPAGHLAHFILDAVEEMDLRQISVNDRGTGSPQYPPRMLLALLLYCYATGVFSSRRIEQATLRQRAGADDLRGHPSRSRHHLHLPAGKQSAAARNLRAGVGVGAGVEVLAGGSITVAVDGTKVIGQRQQARRRQLRARGQNHPAIGLGSQRTAGQSRAGRQHAA